MELPRFSDYRNGKVSDLDAIYSYANAMMRVIDREGQVDLPLIDVESVALALEQSGLRYAAENIRSGKYYYRHEDEGSATMFANNFRWLTRVISGPRQRRAYSKDRARNPSTRRDRNGLRRL